MEQDEEILKSKAELQEKLIKQDITLRIAEAVNQSGLLQRSLYFGDREITPIWADFIESFIKLHKMTMHIIDNDGMIKSFFKNLNTRGFCIDNVIKIDERLKTTDEDADKDRLTKQKESLLKMINATSPHKSLELFDEFMGRLKDAGLLDILTIQMMPNFFFKQPTIEPVEPVEDIPSIEEIGKVAEEIESIEPVKDYIRENGVPVEKKKVKSTIG